MSKLDFRNRTSRAYSWCDILIKPQARSGDTTRSSLETNKIKSQFVLPPPACRILSCACYRIDLISICIKLYQIGAGKRSRRRYKVLFKSSWFTFASSTHSFTWLELHRVTRGGLLPGSRCVTTQVSSVQRGENAQVLSLHNSSAEIKNPYCANSIRGKKEREMGGWVGWGWLGREWTSMLKFHTLPNLWLKNYNSNTNLPQAEQEFDKVNFEKMNPLPTLSGAPCGLAWTAHWESVLSHPC